MAEVVFAVAVGTIADLIGLAFAAGACVLLVMWWRFARRLRRKGPGAGQPASVTGSRRP